MLDFAVNTLSNRLNSIASKNGQCRDKSGMSVEEQFRGNKGAAPIYAGESLIMTMKQAAAGPTTRIFLTKSKRKGVGGSWGPVTRWLDRAAN